MNVTQNNSSALNETIVCPSVTMHIVTTSFKNHADCWNIRRLQGCECRRRQILVQTHNCIRRMRWTECVNAAPGLCMGVRIYKIRSVSKLAPNQMQSAQTKRLINFRWNCAVVAAVGDFCVTANQTPSDFHSDVTWDVSRERVSPRRLASVNGASRMRHTDGRPLGHTFRRVQVDRYR